MGQLSIKLNLTAGASIVRIEQGSFLTRAHVQSRNFVGTARIDLISHDGSGDFLDKYKMMTI